MRFEKGRKKTGGRTKGTLNVATRIEDALAETSVDIWATFDDDWNALEAWERMQVRKWISEFLYSKPKPKEDSLDQVSDEEEVRQLAEQIKAIRDER